MSNKMRGRGDLKHPVEADKVYFWTQKGSHQRGSSLAGMDRQALMSNKEFVAGLLVKSRHIKKE